MSTATVSTPSPLAATARRWCDDLLFHLAGTITGIVGFTLWTAGVALSVCLAITYVGLAITLATLLGVRWFARVERRRAALVLGAPIPERYPAPAAGARWTARLHDLIGEATTWRDFAWCGLAGVWSLALSCVAVSLWAAVLGLVTLPAWYWTIPGGAELGLLDVDALWLALIASANGIVLVPVCGLLVRGLTIADVAVMRAVLRAPGPRRGSADARGAAGATQAGRDAGALATGGDDGDGAGSLMLPLPLHVGLAGLTGLVLATIWAATGGGTFWPIWAWFGLAISVAIHVLALRAWEARGDAERRLRVTLEVCAAIATVCWAIWALSGGGYPWPFWPMLGLATALALRALIVYRDRLPWGRRQALVERVDVLERTRQGALDVQAAELRRIERDLHDGAQARLVALTMQLGRAEERLADRPEVAALVRRAREDAGAAIAELRDLARGIAPPILADRGLRAAIEALGQRSAIPVTIDADPQRRPLPVVETAAYFVVAEALTNVAKHAGGAPAHVTLEHAGDRLVIEVVDRGPGGADAGGGGLTGLRHRVEALDGTLTVASPAGAGTTVRAELPCGV